MKYSTDLEPIRIPLESTIRKGIEASIELALNYRNRCSGDEGLTWEWSDIKWITGFVMATPSLIELIGLTNKRICANNNKTA